jgi:hypothetical protein
MTTHLLVSTLVVLSIALGPASSRAATITIVNIDAPGVGFNDPTGAVPVGGNSGTTVGQQRLIAFQFAADVWGAALDSTVEIRIRSSFTPLACTATAATLGSAGAIQVFANFPGAQAPDTWYHVALANKLAGFDLAPGDPETFAADDINARFNSSIGTAGCLTGITWYYGLDTNHTASQLNLVTVLLHEFAHGLGFQSFANTATGSYLLGLSDIFLKFYFDNTTGKTSDQMTQAERQTSFINPRNVVWTGSHVTSGVPNVLALGTPLLRVNAPASIAGVYQVGAAAFGPQLSSPGVAGDVVAALDPADASGPSTFDGCTPLTNAAAVVGRIALVDRGTCGFTAKVKNAQNAGAIAVIIADNVAGGPPAGLGGADPTITIPSVRITQADGAAIRAALGSATVSAVLGVDLTVRSGADRLGRVLLYTPNPRIAGSSVSHWDTSAFPNQLMEPNINSDLKLAVDVPVDLTHAQLRDVGWYPDKDLDLVPDDGPDQCLNSILSPTVVIGGEDTGVPNTLFTNGCTIRDLVDKCEAGADNHGAFGSCVAHLTNALKASGFISGGQKGEIQSAAAHKK